MFFWGTENIDLHFMSFFHIDVTEVVEIFRHVRHELLILHSQYHGCWFPGDAGSQGIRTHDIDNVKPN